MRSAAVTVAAVFLALSVGGCTGSAPSTTTGPSGTTRPPPGDATPAPDFTVETFDGNTFTLSASVAGEGRPVFLNLWASWCTPCREEMPAIDAAADRHPNVTFLGVAVEDSEQAAAAFAEEIGVSYPLGFDADGTVDRAYNPLGLPESIIISGNGVLLERVIGQVTGDAIDAKLATWFGG